MDRNRLQALLDERRTGFSLPKAFYVDPDAFIEAWSAGRFLRIELTFGSMEISGPILRPAWF